MARLILSFLGTFEARLAGKPITHYQALLVYLVLNCHRAYPREVLATMFWPEEPQNVARKNLRQAFYELRTLLEDQRSEIEPYLLVSQHTASFNPASDYLLDVAEFHKAIDAHDLQTAVAHYHGDLLPGFTYDSLQFEDWLRQERESLHQLALEAMSELAAKYLAAGRLDKAQEIGRRQLELEPWREIAFRQLMQAYAQAGDRGNALAQYQMCRAVLANELGLEPSAETVALYEDIEAGRYSAIRTAATIEPPLKVKHNLPADTTPLIGRELELAEINRLLTRDRRRLVTIVGLGGMGKTRLAMAAGRRLLPHFVDGVYFVDLAPLAESEEIFPAIAAAMDYQAPDKSRELRPQLLETLGMRQLLLILDNFEHLLPGSGMANDILQFCPQVSLLATSRQLLNLASESRYDLGGLEFPQSLSLAEALTFPAVQLFLDSGNRAQPRFSLTPDNVAAVVRICSVVQGIPLGLVLSAAWLGLLAPAEIAAEIEQNLDFLAADLADLPPRQRSMQAVFERSWAMMTAVEQEVMAKLSVFRSGFTREAAAEVAGANLRILLSLTNKSLLQRQVNSNRFTMHELLRQFAAKRRHRADPDDRSALDYCRYFARLIAREVRVAAYYLPLHMPAQFAADRINMRRAWDLALQRGLAEELSDLVRGMAMFSFTQGVPPPAMIRQAINTLKECGLPDTAGPMLRLRLAELWANPFYQSNLRRERDRFLAFIPLAEANGDPELRLWSFDALRGFCSELQEVEQAHAWAAKARQAALEIGDETLIKTMEVIELWDRTSLGEQNVQILKRLKELLAHFEPETPDLFVCYAILAALGEQSRAAKAYEEALEYHKRAMNIAKRWQDLGWISWMNYGLAQTYVQMGLLPEAGLVLLDLLDWHLALGQLWQTLGCLYSIAQRSTQILGHNMDAVAILSMVYHHPQADPHVRTHIDQARSKFEEEMGEVSFSEAWDRGRALDFETAVAQVREALAGVA